MSVYVVPAPPAVALSVIHNGRSPCCAKMVTLPSFITASFCKSQPLRLSIWRYQVATACTGAGVESVAWAASEPLATLTTDDRGYASTPCSTLAANWRSSRCGGGRSHAAHRPATSRRAAKRDMRAYPSRGGRKGSSCGMWLRRVTLRRYDAKLYVTT